MSDQQGGTTDDRELRSQLFEELRFAKKQQWAVAAAAVTFLGAIFAVQHSANPDLGPKEKIAFTVVIVLVATFGCTFLLMLQTHMRTTRLRLNASDKDAAIRGVSIVGVLIGVVVLSSAGVLYFLAFR
jgi:hypothetical protein